MEGRAGQILIQPQGRLRPPPAAQLGADSAVAAPTPPAGAPLGVALANFIISGTSGTLSVDLLRPAPPPDERQQATLLTLRRAAAAAAAPRRAPRHAGGAFGLGLFGRRPPPPPPAAEPINPFIDVDALPTVAFASTGARVKAMRHAQFGPTATTLKYGRAVAAPAFDLGAGFDFHFDTAAARPLLRLKWRDALSLRILPTPALRAQRRLELGASGYAVRVTYECPLASLARCWAPPARLMVSLDNAVDTGVRVTQSGLEGYCNLWLGDSRARLRAAGLLRVPSELPVAEDEMIVRPVLKRAQLKMRW